MSAPERRDIPEAQLRNWTRRLRRIETGKSWELFAAVRNVPAPPDIAPYLGVHGVRRIELLRAIRLALERADAMLVAQGRTPWPETSPKVRICVIGVDDPDSGLGLACPSTIQVVFSTRGADGKIRPRLGAMVALASRSHEPSWELELAQAVSSVVHEWSHCLNLHSLPLRRRAPRSAVSPTRENLRGDLIRSWHWLDEGLAVAAEAHFERHENQRRERGDRTALSVSRDWLRFALDWVDRPERSLDDPLHRYQAAFFVRYVERLTGSPRFLNETWKRSATVWDDPPSTDACALASLAAHFQSEVSPRVFCSSTEPDVFASGFCFDAGFLNDPQSTAHEPLVHARFGDRAITAFLNPGEASPTRSSPHALRGLACRYFHLVAPDRPGKLVVRILPGAETGQEDFRHLKAELGLAEASAPERCQRDSTGQPQRLVLRGQGELRGELPDFSRSRCHHAVLVVTNCHWGIPALGSRHACGHPHEARFHIEARLM